MPVLLPLLIGGLAGAGGMLAGKQLAPKPTAASSPTAPATTTPTLPPTTAATASTNTAAANAAAIKQKRRARGTPPLGAPGTNLGTGRLLGTGGTPIQQPSSLLGY